MNDSFVNSHFPVVPGVGSVSTRRLPGGDVEFFDWHSSGTRAPDFLVVFLQFFDICLDIFDSSFQALVLGVGKGELEVGDLLLLLFLDFLLLVLIVIDVGH